MLAATSVYEERKGRMANLGVHPQLAFLRKGAGVSTKLILQLDRRATTAPTGKFCAPLWPLHACIPV